jgi:hypothetical protein
MHIPPAKPGVAAMAMAGPVPMERPKIITESWPFSFGVSIQL